MVYETIYDLSSCLTTLPLLDSGRVTSAFLLFLKHRHALSSGPLQWLVPLPELLFLQIIYMANFISPFKTLLKCPFLNKVCPDNPI